ncbi:GNAT family N-acetyltransferase [Methylobacterium nonmethylotrophicum]|uniref:GNAT family N-acetyltransferase n=1 Tax=Methylobacterium nonmethylotrophicum TaxID=1141884 RepID=A0A4Z0NJN3_9HYPH|nr:GNAT family N-acetyltransferase [Methylobacterium nonmethylotrophicum]TGD95966.1 GNAT family N-acetyltransferase [Methylobacterium nonmethylotrophicum]
MSRDSAGLPVPGGALRRAVPADAASLAALQEAAYAPNRPLLGVEPVPLLTPAAEVLARYEVWLAEVDGAPAGALVLDPHPDHLTIWSVAVDPSRQGGGLGNALLAAAEARARDLDLSELRLYTGDKLVRNIDWYARRGYATERVEELPDRRLVHMHKRLA